MSWTMTFFHENHSPQYNGIYQNCFHDIVIYWYWKYLYHEKCNTHSFSLFLKLSATVSVQHKMFIENYILWSLHNFSNLHAKSCVDLLLISTPILGVMSRTSRSFKERWHPGPRKQRLESKKVVSVWISNPPQRS